VPQPFLGSPPSESSPRRNRAPLSGPPAPLPLSTDVLRRDPGALSPPVSPTPALSNAVAWFPGRLWDLFPPPRRSASRSPWTPSDGTASFRQLHRLRSLDPPASPYAPTRVAPARRPILSWTSAPLEPSPPTPRILEPTHAQGRGHAPSPKALVRAPRDLTTPGSGVAAPTRKHWNDLVGGTLVPFETSPNRLSTALLLPWPWSPRRTWFP
jgi:hypothetical protein